MSDRRFFGTTVLLFARLLLILICLIFLVPLTASGSELFDFAAFDQADGISSLLTFFLLITGAVLTISVAVILSILKGKRLGRIIRDQTGSIDELRRENGEL